MSRSSPVLAEQNVPRYTSYPTAPHFHAGIGPERYADWLGCIPAGESLSVYLHVPFCVALCHYCGCHTKAVRRREPVEAYAETLADEIALVARHAGRRRVSCLHWGGGTPSILGDGLARVHDALAAAFDLSRHEHAIELDPRHVDRALARTLAAMGVNRASLGVQDFSPHVQQAIGRVQPYDVVARAVDTLREVGIGRINLDLMYGLPRQTVGDIAVNVTLAAALDPDRVALFGYAHVPWFKPRQRLIDAAELPGVAARLAQMEAAREALTACGYEAIGFDHFARPDDDLAVAGRAGTLRRNFQGYTTDDAGTLIGLGASAIGRLAQGFVQNAPDVGGYGRAIRDGRFATARGIALSPDDRLRGAVIERLMCDFSADLDAIARQHGQAERFDAERAALAPYVSDGLVRIDGSVVMLTPRGRPFVRLVAAAFDAWLPQRQVRHSAAV